MNFIYEKRVKKYIKQLKSSELNNKPKIKGKNILKSQKGVN